MAAAMELATQDTSSSALRPQATEFVPLSRIDELPPEPEPPSLPPPGSPPPSAPASEYEGLPPLELDTDSDSGLSECEPEDDDSGFTRHVTLDFLRERHEMEEFQLRLRQLS